MTKKPHETWHKATVAAQTLAEINPGNHGIVPPIHISTTYIRDADNQYSSTYMYARPDNPTTREAEAVIAALEHGEAAALFGSGTAAALTVFQTLRAGDHMIAPKVMYWGMRRWLVEDLRPQGVEIDFVDGSDPEAFRAACRPGKTKLVWIETPANPLWTITDIAAVAKIAHEAGAILGVDSTVSTPMITQPILHGADIVMHSATKGLNGHSDVLAGVLVTAKKDAFWDEILRRRATQGAILGPFESSLLLRGMRTLSVRVAQTSQNAMAIAQHFSKHDKIAEVLYPGLETHPGHAVAAKQMQGGFGCMLSIRLKHGAAAAIGTAANVNIWKRATSLGGVESLIEHRASIEGPDTPVPDDLLRLSTGIEHVDDLIADLEQAIAKT